ncbi:MAG: phosphorylase [Pleurocapsa sp. SU_5_0]|nr:phosphorylase [Pleurocapsa sp. SU_5_0]NJO97574.1 phosphorylase [Pleurocapsa sp. CRU_1_2]NJR44796.1 phosphorylase [Hyellaceae cyanobacterium CSU_1_1]
MEESVNQPTARFLLQPGTLLSKTTEQTEFARQCGALKSIETEYHLIQQQDISFVVRTLSNLTRKEQASKKQHQQEHKTGQKIDPFLPYENDLFVGDLSCSHICLLNKFNVVNNHLLIVTRNFESQTDLLNLEDFRALWRCLKEIDGLAFFNGGKTAGASQSHKHLQLIPLPFLPNVMHQPLEEAIAKITFKNSLGKLDSFAFRHGIAALNISKQHSDQVAVEIMLQKYHALLDYVGFEISPQTQQQPGAYNFLATREWMMIVPRSRESFRNIPINSLGFAGSLFVRDRSDLELLQELTPLQLLTKVAIV